MDFDKIKVISKPESPKAEAILEIIRPVLDQYPCQYQLHEKNLEVNVERNELLITLGGDGTFISVLRNLKNPQGHQINICGLNAGNRGFLCSFDVENIQNFVDLMKKRERPFRRRKRYKTTVNLQGKVIQRYFVNETTVSASRIARLQNIELQYGEKVIDDYLADGIIISSPQGSTAYNLAAGGSIIHHELEAFSITPICPHKLTHRPLVLPDYRTVNLFLKGKETGLVTLDGQETFEINSGDCVSIIPSQEEIFVLRNPSELYVERIRSKLYTTDRDL